MNGVVIKLEVNIEGQNDFNIEDFLVRMERLTKKQRIGLIYQVLNKLKQDKSSLEEEFYNKYKSFVSIDYRLKMNPTMYIDQLLTSSRIKEITSYIQRIDSYLDELLDL